MEFKDLGTVVNHELQPVTIKAPAGTVTWRQIRGFWSFDGNGQMRLSDGATFEESEHESLTLHPGGFAKMIRESGSEKFIVFGTGLSAPPPTEFEGGIVSATIERDEAGNIKSVTLPGTGYS